MKNCLKPYALALLALLAFSCSKDDDAISKTPPSNETVELESEANLFTWNAMNLWYFWQADVAALDDSFNDNKNEFYSYLNEYSDPGDLIENSLRFSEDRFTFYNPDYRTLVDAQQGVFTTNGLEYGLALFSDNNSVYGYVRYVVPNTNAANADIERGEIFTHVDGVALNLNNYSDLLFGPNASYTLGMADLNGTDVTVGGINREDMTLNGKQVTLTKEADVIVNPIHIHKVIEQGGKKIGYIMYNGFDRGSDITLNEVFGDFKSQGVTDLVLDLRYNPGGFGYISRALGSMIYGTNTSDLFSRLRFNEKLQPQFSDDFLEDYFVDMIATPSGDIPVNTLNLTQLYVLTTRGTVSASEQIINALDPYLEVVQVGSTTRGKNEFSFLMVDNPSNSYIYTESTRENINPNVSWAIQPLCGRVENAVGFLDYTSGFEPEIPQPEYLDNLGTLGDPTEPLLARALQEITGISAKLSPETGIGRTIDVITGSYMQYPTRDIMYHEPEEINMKN